MREFHIQWHITNLCNLRCIHCYQDYFDSRDELTLNDLIKISNNLLKTLEKWNAYLFLSLTGGEPLLKHELWDLLEYLGRHKRIQELNLITNGTLIDLNIEKILKSPIKKIFVSLDGTNLKTNDYIRGKGVFNKVMDNIKILKSEGLKINIMYTLMNFNYKEAEELTIFCKENGIDGYILERFFPLGQGKNISSELVCKEDLFNLYKEIFKQTHNDFDFEDIVSTRALQVVLEKEPQVYTAECIVAKDGLAILPEGSILPCRRFNLKIGNLLEEDLSQIWENSGVLNSLRRRENLKGRCKSCKLHSCSGCRAMVYTLTGDYLKEDPHCFLD